MWIDVVGVHADRGEVKVVGLDGRPPFHDESGYLVRQLSRLCTRKERVTDLDHPNSAVSLVQHEVLVWIRL